MFLLKSDETIEDLQLNGLRMIQKKDGFRFGEDSVLIANFVAGIFAKTGNASRTILDLGCNCGSISLILSAKVAGSKITGVEITKTAANIFNRNIELNNLKDKIICIESNWNHLRDFYSPSQVDCIVSNPPYAIPDLNTKKDITDIRIAREEIASSLDQLLEISSYLLKPNGKIFLILRASRMIDVIEGLRKHRLEPRKLRIIVPFADKAPTAFLVMAQKHGKSGGFVFEKPLVLFDSPTVYTKEVADMYGKYPPLSNEELYKDIIRLES